MRRTVLMFVLAGLVGAVVAVPIVVYASHQFTDVPDTNPFHADIDWLADAGVTKGCAPTEYCPKNNVTREQMAAFMRRLSGNDPTVAPSVNAGQLGGYTATELAPRAVWGATSNAPDGDQVDPNVWVLAAPVNIDAPVDGTVIVHGQVSGLNNGLTREVITCSVRVGGEGIATSIATADLGVKGDFAATCNTSGAVNVPAGNDIKVELVVSGFGFEVVLLSATVQGVWYPFDGTGNEPFVP
ncbi:MAG: S-layer homology domain-containing protein [Gemmatimonadales bacterium]